ncbi:MAG: hypothetical protein OXC05_01890 [Halieaceae bacterium]|nr:hypothetical protein [Halieaceae bacterium]
MPHTALVDAYHKFMVTARRYVDPRTEDDYQQALIAIEELLELAEDTKDEPLNPLIDLVNKGIEAYETRDNELMEFQP